MSHSNYSQSKQSAIYNAINSWNEYTLNLVTEDLLPPAV